MSSASAVGRRTAGDKHIEAERLRRVEKLAHFMDASFRIPGVPVRFGWDSVIGLIPGLGDVVSAATGVWIMNEAYRSGISRFALAKMLGNVTVDVTVGSIPLVGDVFDVFWKSNVRNAKLLERHLRAKSTSRS